MKRRQLLLGIAACLLAGFSGCQKETDTGITFVTPTPAPAQEESAADSQEEVLNPVAITPTPVPEGMVTSWLTGEYVAQEQGRRRPVAVMFNNIIDAVPQTGISRAGVIYEAPVEGGITRLMGIFEDYDGLEKIGSVRSCRDYFIFYATGFDAIYAHYGQSAYAEQYLAMDEVDNLSGLSGYGDQVYYRTQDRNPPHNAYTSAAGIQAGINYCGYRTDYSEGYAGAWKFAEPGTDSPIPGGSTANTVTPGYGYNEPWFEYDPQTGQYLRFQYGGTQIDDMDGSQLAVKNILLQYSDWQYYDENGYLNIDVTSSGAGKYITNGTAQDVTWSKDGLWGATHFYDSGGQEITLNPGKTWVCVILDADAVTIG